VNPERQFLAALSAYARGDHPCAARYCARALRDSVPTDVLMVRLIHLYLIATELWGNGPTFPEEVGALVERAQADAKRVGDPALQAIASCMRGRYLISADSLPAAIVVFSDAAKVAAASGNLLAQLEALSELGHNTVGVNLARGLAILRRAQVLADSLDDDGAPACDRPLLPVQRARLAGLIGAAVFDDGGFGEAETWLRRSLATLRGLGAWEHAALISNYLGQLLTEMGRFEEAQDVLLDALEPLRAHADQSAYQGYNLGQLGRLYLDWGRLEAAEENITAGWDRLQRSQDRSILPILRNYLGELLMHPSYPRRDPGRARQVFDETIAECQRTGFQRSEITALALRALADLDLGDRHGALTASSQAVQRLAETGIMPTVRTEQIYFVRYRVLDATGADAEAADWLARARETISTKAATITLARLRDQFLTRAPTSREILSAGRVSP
jgi:tetratricopeptide (TPR) repeat protein